MALPKLNSTPSYTVKVPSTGQQVSFRPFLVKEQKNLLIALETQDRKDLLKAIVKTIEHCVEDEIKSPMTTVDVDYLFTMIRSKSVGENAEIYLECSNCETANKISVDLESLEIANLDKPSKIEISKGISIKMRCPTYMEFLESTDLSKSESQSQLIFELVIICMEAVLTEEERVAISDEKREDIVNFLESMTAAQYEKLANFILELPYLYKDIEYKCTECGTENKKTLQGMDDFF
jgi:hypothetical protein